MKKIDMKLINEIESFFEKKYGHKAILFPSAIAGIASILRFLKIDRSKEFLLINGFHIAFILLLEDIPTWVQVLSLLILRLLCINGDLNKFCLKKIISHRKFR